MPLYFSDTLVQLYIKVTGLCIGPANRVYMERIRRVPLNFNPHIFLHGSYLAELPNMRLRVEDGGMDTLDRVLTSALARRFLSKEDNMWAHALLVSAGRSLPVKIRIHGKTRGNYIGLKKSYCIRNCQKRDGFTSFNLVNPKQHNYLVPLLANNMAKRLGLICNEQHLVHLTVNAYSAGTYWLEEHINSAFLQKRHLSGAILKLKDNWIENSPAAAAFSVQCIADLKKIRHSDADAIRYRYNELLTATSSLDIEALAAFFNLDYMAKYEAFRCLFGVCHDVMWENLKLFYNDEDGKFYPIVRVEGDLNPIAFVEGSLVPSFNNCRFLNLDKDILMQAFILLNNNHDFRIRKFKAMAEIVQSFPKWNKAVDVEIGKCWNALLYDPEDFHSIREKQIMFNQYEQTLQSNVALMQKQLRSAFCYINILENDAGITVKITPDGEMPVMFEHFTLFFKTTANTSFSTTVSMGGASYKLSADSTGKLDITMPLADYAIMPDFSAAWKLESATFTCLITAEKDALPLLAGYDITAINPVTADTLSGRQLNVAIGRKRNPRTGVTQSQ